MIADEKMHHSTVSSTTFPFLPGVNVLRQHIYTSLAEVQIQHEDDIAKYPLSKQTEDIFVENSGDHGNVLAD